MGNPVDMQFTKTIKNILVNRIGFIDGKGDDWTLKQRGQEVALNCQKSEVFNYFNDQHDQNGSQDSQGYGKY